MTSSKPLCLVFNCRLNSHQYISLVLGLRVYSRHRAVNGRVMSLIVMVALSILNLHCVPSRSQTAGIDAIFQDCLIITSSRALLDIDLDVDAIHKGFLLS